MGVGRAKWQALSRCHLICLHERRSWDYDFWLFFVTLALNVASMVQARWSVSLLGCGRELRCVAGASVRSEASCVFYAFGYKGAAAAMRPSAPVVQPRGHSALGPPRGGEARRRYDVSRPQCTALRETPLHLAISNRHLNCVARPLEEFPSCSTAQGRCQGWRRLSGSERRPAKSAGRVSSGPGDQCDAEELATFFGLPWDRHEYSKTPQDVQKGQGECLEWTGYGGENKEVKAACKNKLMKGSERVKTS
eukprot:Skav204238  [mRNA]  locus=scaffold1550:323359:328398:- [translate_table: standard]